MFVGFKNENKASTGMSKDPSEDGTVTSELKIVESLNIKYPVNYLQELGKCVVEILSGIYSMEHDLLSTFCVAFQEKCLKTFQQKENAGRNTEDVEPVIKFLSLLEQHSAQKGETWPLVYLVGPMLAKSFPLIRSLVSYYSLNMF